MTYPHPILQELMIPFYQLWCSFSSSCAGAARVKGNKQPRESNKSAVSTPASGMMCRKRRMASQTYCRSCSDAYRYNRAQQQPKQYTKRSQRPRSSVATNGPQIDDAVCLASGSPTFQYPLRNSQMVEYDGGLRPA